MRKPQKNGSGFRAIAERRFKVSGLSSREVTIRIGIPEREQRDSRCPFQVVGLSNDAVRYAYGVDSLQALNLALVGARNAVQNDVRVLSAFHRKLKLTLNGQPWDLSLPIWVCVFDKEQLGRLEAFMEKLRATRRRARRRPRKRTARWLGTRRLTCGCSSGRWYVERRRARRATLQHGSH